MHSWQQTVCSSLSFCVSLVICFLSLFVPCVCVLVNGQVHVYSRLIWSHAITRLKHGPFQVNYHQKKWMILDVGILYFVYVVCSLSLSLSLFVSCAWCVGTGLSPLCCLSVCLHVCCVCMVVIFTGQWPTGGRDQVSRQYRVQEHSFLFMEQMLAVVAVALMSCLSNVSGTEWVFCRDEVFPWLINSMWSFYENVFKDIMRNMCVKREPDVCSLSPLSLSLCVARVPCAFVF